jgi:crossover junction endodeoxyribonuclease RuvC
MVLAWRARSLAGRRNQHKRKIGAQGARAPAQSQSAIDFAKTLCHARPVGITARQFEAMERRVAGERRRATAVRALVAEPARTSPGTIILGIDPSLRGTGYGVIRLQRPHPLSLDQGTIRCPANWTRSRCLAEIAARLRRVIEAHHPTIGVVEGLFYAQNLQTALIMGEARGAALVAAAEAGLEICEIAPRKVKQAIVGYGGARKFAVARMVQRLLNLAAPPEPDAADALALALTHAQESARPSLTPVKRI